MQQAAHSASPKTFFIRPACCVCALALPLVAVNECVLLCAHSPLQHTTSPQGCGLITYVNRQSADKCHSPTAWQVCVPGQRLSHGGGVDGPEDSSGPLGERCGVGPACHPQQAVQ